MDEVKEEKSLEERVKDLECRASTHNLIHGISGFALVIIGAIVVLGAMNRQLDKPYRTFGTAITVKKGVANDILQQEERIKKLEDNQLILSDVSERTLDHMLKLNDQLISLTNIVRDFGGK